MVSLFFDGGLDDGLDDLGRGEADRVFSCEGENSQNKKA
jgi:hypothetical protein